VRESRGAMQRDDKNIFFAKIENQNGGFNYPAHN
jgi:hypothetical protein